MQPVPLPSRGTQQILRAASSAAARARRHPWPTRWHLRRALTVLWSCPVASVRDRCPPGVEPDHYVGGDGAVSGFLALTVREFDSIPRLPVGGPQRSLTLDLLTRVRTGPRTWVRAGLPLFVLVAGPVSALGPLVAGVPVSTARIRAQESYGVWHLQAENASSRVDLTSRPGNAELPPGSPFRTAAAALRFASPPVRMLVDHPGGVVLRTTLRTQNRGELVALELTAAELDHDLFADAPRRLAGAARLGPQADGWGPGEVVIT